LRNVFLILPATGSGDALSTHASTLNLILFSVIVVRIAHGTSTPRQDEATHWLQQTQLSLLCVVDRHIQFWRWDIMDDERISRQAIIQLGTSWRKVERIMGGITALHRVDEQVVQGVHPRLEDAVRASSGSDNDASEPAERVRRDGISAIRAGDDAGLHDGTGWVSESTSFGITEEHKVMTQ
jgi:hypothetical protein